MLGAKVRMRGISLGDDARFKGPIDREFGIVPAHTPFQFGAVEFVHQVEDFRIISEAQKSVSTAFWSQHHGAVFSGLFGTKPLAEGVRLWPQIQNTVPDRPSNAANEFGLCCRSELVVHATQGALVGAE